MAVGKIKTNVATSKRALSAENPSLSAVHRKEKSQRRSATTFVVYLIARQKRVRFFYFPNVVRIFTLTLLFNGFLAGAFAQNGYKISGFVREAGTDLPLAGVNIAAARQVSIVLAKDFKGCGLSLTVEAYRKTMNHLLS